MKDMSKSIGLKNVEESDIDFLYNLRKEYVDFINSLKGNEIMPSFKTHTNFVRQFVKNDKNHPYHKWYLIMCNDERVGVIPLKKNGEFGYQVQKKFQSRKICQVAIELFFNIHPKKDLRAKTVPKNKLSQHLLEKWGFKLTNKQYYVHPQE